MSELALSSQPRALGKSGITVGPLAWGMWRFGHASLEEGRRLVEAALEIGVTLFDTADIYGFDGASGFGGAETLLGRVLADAPGLRERMVLATKGGITPPVPYDSSRDYLLTALDNSLRRLGVEQVDLYQIHRPDILTHPHEVARTLETMVSSGKVRAVGVSNYTPDQSRALAAFLSVPLATQQPEFSPLHLEPMVNGLFDQAMKHDVAVLAWSPLGGGRIAKPTTEREHAVAAALDAVAAKFGVGRSAVAYSWIAAHPIRPIPIVGTQKVARLAEFAEVHRVRWTRADWYAVLTAARGEKLP